MRGYVYLKYPAFTIHVVIHVVKVKDVPHPPKSWLVSVTCMLIILSPLFHSVGRQCHYSAGPVVWDGRDGEGMLVC